MQSHEHPNVTLVNFNSSAYSISQTVKSALDAYERSMNILIEARKYFLRSGRKAAITGQTALVFRRYFGMPHAAIEATDLRFNMVPTTIGPSGQQVLPLRFTGQVGLGEVVGAALRRLFQVYLSDEPVKIHLGGHNILPSHYAYVRRTIRPTDIYLGPGFFEADATTRAGTLLHELSHTWCGTLDHFYGKHACNTGAVFEPAHAVTNADSYEFFLEEAFG